MTLLNKEVSTADEWRMSSNEAPFHKAVQYGKLDFVKAMIKFGIDTNCYCIMESTKRTALDLAIEHDKEETFLYLLDIGADPNKENHNMESGK